MNSNNKYYKLSDYYKHRFGCRVYKVSLDAGFSCPNRDGTKSSEGCIYCDNRGFSYNTRIEPPEAYTNTYASPEMLREKYSIVKNYKDIVGISIGTRPDCINEEILDIINEFTDDYEVWIEYGLQSVNDKTLNKINRQHSYKDFLQAYKLTKNKGDIKICAHVIIGLPDESSEDIMETAKELGRIKVDGVKIHPMHIVKNTALEEEYNAGSYKPMSLDEYIKLASDFMEYLHPDTVIHRITADCSKEFLVAPEWINEKNRILNELNGRLESSGKYQGRLYGKY
jgi:radical SAM protein (TIGR01212 family)